MDLTHILKDHKGKTFYSPLFGDIVLISTKSHSNYPLTFNDADNIIRAFTKDGKYLYQYTDTECLIFPSKDQRDWEKWDKENNKKIPKTWGEYLTCYESDDEPTLWFDADMVADSIGHACSALFKINQLIKVGYGGNVTNKEWYDDDIPKYCISSALSINECWSMGQKELIAFHTIEQAKEFLSYPKNIQLLKDFYMI